MTTNPTSGAADLPEALRIDDALNQADRAEAAALSYGEGTTLGIEAYASAKTIRALHSRLQALAAGQAVAPAEPLHITHGPLMRHAAALLRSRKPVLPDHEDVAAELERAVDGHPTPSGAPSAEWLEVARIAEIEARPAPPAMDGGGAEMPSIESAAKALAWVELPTGARADFRVRAEAMLAAARAAQKEE